MIYVKTCFSAQQVSFDHDDSVKDNVWAEIKLQQGDSLLLGCVYRSPNSTKEQNVSLYSLLADATKLRTHILICGDFNHPEIEWNNETSPRDPGHKATRFMDSVIRDLFLTQHVRHPTHYRCEQNPTLIDLILTNEDGMIQKITHEAPLGKSHHQMLHFSLLCYTDTPTRNTQERYNFNKGDYDLLSEKVRNCNLEENIQTLNIMEAWDKLSKSLTKAMDICIPKSRKFHSERNLTHSHRKPLWWNDKAMMKLKKKREAFQRYMNTREGSDYLLYAKARNQAKGVCRSAVRDYERSIAKQAKSNPKAFYSYANSKLKTKQGVADLVDPNGLLVTGNKDKGDVLNSFFVSVFTEENLNTMPPCDTKPHNTSLRKIVFTKDKVLKKLKALDSSKSPGPDGLHAKVLTELADELAGPLTIIFNKSIQEGLLPTEWKTANVTPLFKKGDKSKPGNYRPVSLTSQVCKVMESLIRDEVIKHMDINKFLSEYQHGFVTKRSCVTNLLNVLDSWTKALDKKNPVDTIYLDFAKAFDSVPHQRLLLKLKSYAIEGDVLAWIEDFLVGRSQRVTVNGCHSSWSSVASGVPQGSVLGPVLFVIFINDMPQAAESNCQMYADDTKLFRIIQSQADTNILQKDLNNLVDWSDKWQLRFNADKCKILHLGRTNPQSHYKMRLNNSKEEVTLESSKMEKDLGVMVDHELKFSKHIEIQVNKANKILGLIRRSYQYLDTHMIRLLFIALIRPHLEFANSVWSPLYQKDKDLIEGVLRRATKLIPGLKKYTYEVRLAKLQIPSMQYRRNRGDMVETYKYMHGIYKTQNLFEIEGNSVTRGHQYKITKQRCFSSQRQQFFRNRVVNSWNNLPETVVNAPTLQAFMNRLDKLWTEHKYKL